MILNLGGWRQYTCTIPAVLTCACQHPQQMYLKLRGLCPQSNIDRFYVPRNKRQSGSVQVIGLKKTTIEYDKGDLMWSLAVESHNTSATSEAAFESYALGAHEWIIQDDSTKCSHKGETYRSLSSY